MIMDRPSNTARGSQRHDLDHDGDFMMTMAPAQAPSNHASLGSSKRSWHEPDMPRKPVETQQPIAPQAADVSDQACASEYRKSHHLEATFPALVPGSEQGRETDRDMLLQPDFNCAKSNHETEALDLCKSDSGLYGPRSAEIVNIQGDFQTFAKTTTIRSLETLNEVHSNSSLHNHGNSILYSLEGSQGSLRSGAGYAGLHENPERNYEDYDDDRDPQSKIYDHDHECKEKPRVACLQSRGRFHQTTIKHCEKIVRIAQADASTAASGELNSDHGVGRATNSETLNSSSVASHVDIKQRGPQVDHETTPILHKLDIDPITAYPSCAGLMSQHLSNYQVQLAQGRSAILYPHYDHAGHGKEFYTPITHADAVQFEAFPDHRSGTNIIQIGQLRPFSWPEALRQAEMNDSPSLTELGPSNPIIENTEFFKVALRYHHVAGYEECRINIESKLEDQPGRKEFHSVDAVAFGKRQFSQIVREEWNHEKNDEDCSQRVERLKLSLGPLDSPRQLPDDWAQKVRRLKSRFVWGVHPRDLERDVDDVPIGPRKAVQSEHFISSLPRAALTCDHAVARGSASPGENWDQQRLRISMGTKRSCCILLLLLVYIVKEHEEQREAAEAERQSRAKLELFENNHRMWFRKLSTQYRQLQDDFVQLEEFERCRLKQARVAACSMGAAVATQQSVQRRLWVKIRSQAWWERCNHPGFPDLEFHRAFRMSRPTFELICDELQSMVAKEDTMLRAAIPVKQRVAVCIWRLATGEPLRLVSKRFGLGISTCHKLILEVCAAINDVLLAKYVQWPAVDRLQELRNEFEGISGLRNVVGAMYTSHIPIIAPKINVAAYFNKRHTDRNQKTSYSITLQGVVDIRGSFTDVCIGWPGSMSDDRVLESSALYQKGIGGSLRGSWVVGGHGYPLLDWLLVPYSQPSLTWPQHTFNARLMEVQKVAKGAFSRLKGRWKFLQRRTEVKLQELPAVLGACCVLHNVCEQHGEGLDPDLTYEVVDDSMYPEGAPVPTAALEARDLAARHLHNVNQGGAEFI